MSFTNTLRSQSAVHGAAVARLLWLGGAAIIFLPVVLRADGASDFPGLLRAASQEVVDRPFNDEELWFDLHAKESSGVLVDIGLAQLAIDDLEGATRTAELLPSEDDCWNCNRYRDFVSKLAARLVCHGRRPLALEIIKAKRNKGPETFLVSELMSIARSQAESEQFDQARQTCRQAVLAVDANPLAATLAYAGLARLQSALGDKERAWNTVRLAEDAGTEIAPIGQERGLWLAEMSVLYAALGDGTAARRVLRQAPSALEGRPFGWENSQSRIAAAYARIGDSAEAIRVASLIPESSGYRGAANMNIALHQCALGDLGGAEATALSIDPSHDYRNLVLLEVAKSHANAGEIRKALSTAANVADDVRRAQAIIEIAAIMAQQGDTASARKLVLGLDYPYVRNPFITGHGQGIGKRFSFANPKTWGLHFKALLGFTMGSALLGEEIESEFLAAVVHCHVRLDGPGTLGYTEEMDAWDMRSVAEAQAAAGDASGVLALAAKLPPSRRLSALIGGAEGVAERRRAVKAGREAGRLNQRSMLRLRWHAAFSDDL